jgi:DNA-binding HxlR family transcriptional regulator
MAESDELFTEVAQIHDELEEQGGMINALVRASSKEVTEELLEDFRKDPTLRAIYLMIDGTKSQGEIQADLAKKKLPGSSPSAVSNKLKKLFQDGLIVKVRRTKAGIVYRKTRLDTALGITHKIN